MLKYVVIKTSVTQRGTVIRIRKGMIVCVLRACENKQRLCKGKGQNFMNSFLLALVEAYQDLFEQKHSTAGLDREKSFT